MGRNALVVEPDAAFSRQVCAMLADLGYAAETVRSGKQARARLEQQAYAAVVTELSLPELDGFELLKAIRRRAPSTTTRVVVISPFVQLRNEALARRAELGIEAVIARGGSAGSMFRALSRLRPDVAEDAAEVPVEVEAPPPVDESARLRAVRRLAGDMDAEDPEMQVLVEDVARAFGVSTAFVSLVLEDRQRLRAEVGAGGSLKEERGGPRDISFCRHVVEADVPRPLLVPDAAIHPVFMKNPLVLEGSVRSYAGAPLVTSDGQVLGTLCLVDRKPLVVGAADVDRLVLVARQVTGMLELRAARERERALGTALEKAARAEAATALRWSALLEALDVGVVVMGGQDRTVYMANAAMGAFMGADVGAWVGRPREVFVEHLATLAVEPDLVRQQLAAPEVGPFAGTAVLELARPVPRVLRWVARPVVVEGTTLQVATYTDITAEFRLAELRQREAHVDVLTGVANRRGFRADAERELTRAAREGTSPWVVVLDVDHFKRVNDTHGHAAGDELLVALASALRSTLRAGDVLGRLGGEEFALLLSHAPDAAHAAAAAERMRQAVENLQVPTGRVTLSAGVARVEAGDLEDALRRADARLYEAKAQGRNRVIAEV